MHTLMPGASRVSNKCHGSSLVLAENWVKLLTARVSLTSHLTHNKSFQRDESFRQHDCTGTDNQKTRKQNTIYILITKREREKINNLTNQTTLYKGLPDFGGQASKICLCKILLDFCAFYRPAKLHVDMTNSSERPKNATTGKKCHSPQCWALQSAY